jgi:hypothetical protein
MLYWIIFAAEIIFLFLTSKHIFQNLFILFKRIFRRDSLAVIPIFIILFPGVLVHEFAHYLAAEILLVGAYDMEVSPKIHNGMFEMGSVKVRKTDIFRSFLIGVAPLFTGLGIVFPVVFYFVKNFVWKSLFTLPGVTAAIFVSWIVFFITNTMFSSKKDMENSFLLLIIVSFLILVFLVTAFMLNLDMLQPTLVFLDNPAVLTMIKKIDLIFSFPVLINGVVLSTAGAIVKKTI